MARERRIRAPRVLTGRCLWQQGRIRPAAPRSTPVQGGSNSRRSSASRCLEAQTGATRRSGNSVWSTRCRTPELASNRIGNLFRSSWESGDLQVPNRRRQHHRRDDGHSRGAE
jgi:hypothetical protein